MPRQNHALPTNIYWLYDIRPQTVEMCGPRGRPFYCGKTIYDIEFRLRGHRHAAIAHPHRRLSVRLVILGTHVQTELKEVVPFEDDWVAREQHWIRLLRDLHPDCANASRGGQGTPGFVPSVETRLKMRAAKLGKKFSAEHREKLRAALLGRTAPPFSPEHRAKLSAASIRRNQHPVPAEARAKMRAAKLGKKHSAEHLAKGRRARRERIAPVVSAETRAKIGAAHKGKMVSESTRAKLRASALLYHAKRHSRG